MRVTFNCGHPAVLVPETVDQQPTCPMCGDRLVRAVQARAPRFVGLASGPYCETRPLDAIPVNLAPKGPLVLKEEERSDGAAR